MEDNTSPTETIEVDGDFTYEEETEGGQDGGNLAPGEAKLGDVGALLEQEEQRPRKRQRVSGNIVKETRKELTKEETARHQELLLQCVRWGESEVFGQYLYTCSFRLQPNQLRPLSVEELEDTLVRVKTTAMSMQSKGALDRMVLGGCRLLEEISTKNDKIKAKCDLTGWTQVVSRDESVRQAIELCRLTTAGGNLLNLPPPVLLILALAQSAASVSAINKYVKNRRIPAAESGPVPMPGVAVDGETKDDPTPP